MIASAPGKIILFGEHAVVYGKHALVSAINRRCYVEVKRSFQFKITSELGTTSLDFKIHPYVSFAVKRFCEVVDIKGAEIRIRSDIPVASGLGSSAAVTVATIAALSAEFEGKMDKEEIAEMAKMVEIDVQGRASGIDPFISTYGGTWLFPEREKIDCEMRFFLINLGKKSTAEMVGKVAKLRERYGEIVTPIFNAIDAVSLRAFHLLKEKSVESVDELDELIRINQSLLRALGVSNHRIDRLISELEKAGLVAKITGAGGGGCIYGLLKDGVELDIPNLKDYETASTEREGVRVEETENP